MHVIGSGFGRTGTLSLKRALEILGFGPCYHMEEVFKRPGHIRAWHRLAQGETPDWTRLLRGFNAAVDFPTSIVYRQLLDAFPQAKVIHTVRDPMAWYASTRATIYRGTDLFPPWLLRIAPPLRELVEMQQQLIWDGLFQGAFDDAAQATAIFQAWTEEVRATVPPDRLLIYRAQEGWAPLCAFLDRPVPAVPFPWANERRAMQRKLGLVRHGLRWGPPIMAGLALPLLWWTVSKRWAQVDSR